MIFISLQVDHNRAKDELVNALAVASKLTSPQSKFSREIATVILGNHLTYRYILITNLLAKVIEPRVNALALQSGADFNNAFDSRSLCHKVFVPFERDHLQGRLGRSNEPYLNKPARHKALSSDNAVRRGYDLNILNTCILILSTCTASEAKAALADSIFFTLQRSVISDHIANTSSTASLKISLAHFGEKIIAESHEGETCALLTGLSFYLLSTISTKELVIKVHPVNQSGASSKEILDIDVFIESKLRFTAEVKDKSYSKQDFEHAANKVRAAEFDSMFFILGPRANQIDNGNLEDIVFASTGITVTTISILNFYKMSLALSSSTTDINQIWSTVVAMCNQARFKQTTLSFLKKVALDTGLISS